MANILLIFRCDFISFVLDTFENSPYFLDVRDQLKDMKSGDEMRHIQALRASLNAISSQSAEAMKKSVFMNYQKFIDTSKEVSREYRCLYIVHLSASFKHINCQNEYRQLGGCDEFTDRKK